MIYNVPSATSKGTIQSTSARAFPGRSSRAAIGSPARRSEGRVALGCSAGEVLTVVHRATNSSVRRRRETSTVEYTSIQGTV